MGEKTGTGEGEGDGEAETQRPGSIRGAPRLRSSLPLCLFALDPRTFFSCFKIEVELIYNIVLVSGVQQSDSVMCTYIYFFPDYFPL